MLSATFFGEISPNCKKKRNRMGIFCHSNLFILLKSPNFPQIFFLKNFLPHSDFDFNFIDL
jgi:hypothetical protein